MNLSELQSVQARERQSDSLQELRPSFYRDAADFVADLREERTRVAAEAEDPFEDSRVTQLTDDIRTAQGTIEAIYERRVGKVVKLASLAAADMPTEENGLTTEEQELYETLVAAIETHREDVLATLTEEGPDDDHDGSPSTGPQTDDADRPTTEAAAAGQNDAVDAAEVMAPKGTGPPSRRDDGGRAPEEASAGDDGGADGSGADGQPTDEGSRVDGDEAGSASGTDAEGSSGGTDSGDDTERTTVRITEDVGAILGVDEREYDLAIDDVVTLPAANAAPLIERDAAEPLE